MEFRRLGSRQSGGLGTLLKGLCRQMTSWLFLWENAFHWKEYLENSIKDDGKI